MLVAGVELSVLQVLAFAQDAFAFETYMLRQGVQIDRRHLVEVAEASLALGDDEIAAARRPPPTSSRRFGRHDVDALVDFVDAHGRLPGRVREVFELCIRQGHTIEQCAHRLGIGRESVRTHLRRLRALARSAR